MRIITANLNGIRSAANKGFFVWLQSTQADVVCLQELKAQAADMTAERSEERRVGKECCR